MNTQILKIATILFIAFISTSCNKDDDNPTPSTTTANYFFKAKINGVQYDTGASLRVLANNDKVRISITSVLSDGRNFELKLTDPKGVGTYTYPVPAGADYLINMEYGDATAPTALWKTGACSGTIGTITITELSATEISGTFSFVGKRTSFCSDPPNTITDGSFKSGLIL
jgi:hypothetical protein